MIELPKHSDLLKLPELLYGIIKKIGILNNEPILYGDVNLLKPGDLFYFASAHQIYRYVGTRGNNAALPILPGIGIENPIGGGVLDPIEPQVVEYQTSYIFEEVEPMLDGFMSNGLTIPDELRGTVKRVGKLFNKIIYSGDPNLVDSGNLYYHEAFPLISTVGIDDDGIITLSADWIGMYGNVSTMNVKYRVSPFHDYSKDYFTTEALGETSFEFRIRGKRNITLLSYSIDNGETWVSGDCTKISVQLQTPVIPAGGKVLWKGVGTKFSNTNLASYDTIRSNNKFTISGNIMSLLYGDDFEDKTEFAESSVENFYYFFKDNTLLIDAKNLILPPTVTANCYNYMFYSCTNLKSAPKLPATTLALACYSGMFQWCASLKSIPTVLPATTLAYLCYSSMFWGCTSLTKPPKLPATTLTNYCYYGMFGYTSLRVAPELPATTLATSCYNSMFQNCILLTTAPKLSATTLADECYRYMFRGCTSLTAAPKLPATTLASGCYGGMLSDTDLLPDCTNIDFTSDTVVTSGGLRELFFKTKITDRDLAKLLPKNNDNKPCLPATTLASYCYYCMFQDCTLLTTAPELPATTLKDSCYTSMFYGCTALTTAPELPALTLANYCYQYMFYNCTSLTTAPELNATTLKDLCYYGMFGHCSSLITAPELPAITLVGACYKEMFFDCSSLNYIKAMFITTASGSCYNWVKGVAQNGTFVKNSDAEWDVTGDSGVPTGWTVETADA